jgi:8-oxo-dGTP pyrophosphatase MutT (NUDIX family)
MAMKHFYVGIKGLIKTEKGYLLVRHKKGHYEIPGGRIDDDENFEQTIIRELDEELPGTTEVSLGELIGASRVHRDIDEGVSLVLLYFIVHAKVLDKPVLGEEHESYIWVNTVDDLPDGLFPGFEEILRKVFAK